MATLGELAEGSGSVYRTHDIDRWGRSRFHPDFGRPPGGTGPTAAQPEESSLVGGPAPMPVGNDVRRRELPSPDAGWAHPAEAFAPDASIMAPRLMGANGQFTLYEHGNQRPLQPDEVAAAQGYVGDFWRQFPTGFQPGIGPQTNAEYGGDVPTFNPQWTTMGSASGMPAGGPYARYTSGGLMPGAGRGIGTAAGWGPSMFGVGRAISGAFPGGVGVGNAMGQAVRGALPFFGGSRGGGNAGLIRDRWRGGGTLGSLSSYAPPSDEDAVQVP